MTSSTEKSLPESQVFVCSVGGSIQPVIHSIDTNQPLNVVYVASRDTRGKIEEIRDNLNWRGIRDTHIITISDFQDLLACVLDIRAGLQEYLRIRSLPEDTLMVADITGGTKIMAAALTLVMMEYPSRFSYVGGSRRSKAGVGIVEEGCETLMRMDNPWEVMGLREARSLVEAFNSGQYASAREAANFLKKRKTEYGEFYSGIADIVSSFMQWDIFDYKAANTQFNAGLRVLRAYNNRSHPAFQELFSQFQSCSGILERVYEEAKILKQGKSALPLQPDAGRIYLIDLVSNAYRCAQQAHYDDAVARLYSAIEKTAKIALAKIGKNNSRLAMEDLQQAGSHFVEKYSETLAAQGYAQLPLFESFRYLQAIDGNSPVSRAFEMHETELQKTLEARNMSLLAHGYNPVLEKEFIKLFDIALEFMQIKKEELHQFPRIQLRAMLL